MRKNPAPGECQQKEVRGENRGRKIRVLRGNLLAINSKVALELLGGSFFFIYSFFFPGWESVKWKEKQLVGCFYGVKVVYFAFLKFVIDQFYLFYFVEKKIKLRLM